MKVFLGRTVSLLAVIMFFTVYLSAQTIDSNLKTNDLTDGLIAYYPFNANANDESGNGNDGIDSCTTYVQDRFGNENSALEFDGIDDYVIFNDEPFDFDKVFCISWWMKTKSTKSDQRLLFKNNEPPDRSWFISLNFSDSGKLTFFSSKDGTDSKYFRTYGIYNDGLWHHVVFIYNGNNNEAIFYKDAIIDSKDNEAYSSLHLNDQPFSIGNTNNGPCDVYLGDIDDIKIYNRALSNSEVQELYNENGWTGDKQLLAHYPLDGNANDESGNELNGDNHGATTTTDRFGNENSAMEFDGSSYIDCGVDPISNNGSVSFTAWCYPTNTAGGYVISSGAQTSAVGYASSYQNQQFFVARKTETFYSHPDWFGSYPDNQWYFVAGVYDETDSTMDIYINNDFIGNFENKAANYSKKYKNLIIGKANNVDGGYFKGKIDDIRIYNYVLSKNEINELYYENGWKEKETLTDIDGNVYKTVKIGNQTWMAENLKVTRYRNGDAIPNVTGNSEWAGLTTGAWCVYDNNEANTDTYGLLYNWYAVAESRNIAPAGWHVPTDEEYTELENHLVANGYNWDGTTIGNKIGKALAAKTGWVSSSEAGDVGNDMSTNNASGFNGLPGGYRYDYGAYTLIGSNGTWWSLTEYSSEVAWARNLTYDNSNFYLGRSYKQGGFNLRCIKDNANTLTLTSPKGGESWTTGSQHQITWTAGDSVKQVKIEYSLDGGQNWIEEPASIAASAGSYLWTTPDDASDNCLIKISKTEDADIFDESGVFQIYNTVPVRIKVIQKGTYPEVRYVELWWWKTKSYITSTIDDRGYAEFSKEQFNFLFALLPPKDQDDKLDLYLLDDNKEVIGKINFSYLFKTIDAGRSKEAIVILHNDLVSYENHPDYVGNEKWAFGNYYMYDYHDPEDAFDENNKLNNHFSTTMLIPPSNSDGSYLLSNIHSDLHPILFVHGVTGTDVYWGDDEEIIDPAIDNFDNNYNGKIDYPFTSYPARLTKMLDNEYDTWEYYYPPDANWKDSGYLLGKDIKELLRYYLTNKITIIAHSMGGLVTRAYFEEFAETYYKNGTSTEKMEFNNDVDKVIFLASPQHGSFLAAKAFWEIHISDWFTSNWVGKDPNAPAFRQLELGSTPIFDLNNHFSLNETIKYVQFSGTKRGIVNESENHDDGAVAISSGNLVNKGINVGLLKEFDHGRMRNPDDLKSNQKNIIPELCKKYLLDENDYNETDYLHWINGNEIASPSVIFDNIHLDIALPIVRFKKADNSFWIPLDKEDNIINTRFQISVDKEMNKNKAIILSKEKVNNGTFSYNKNGMFFYYSENNFTEYEYKNNINDHATTFYAYEEDGLTNKSTENPFNSDYTIQSEGTGWHLPGEENKNLQLDVYLGYQVEIAWKVDPWKIYKIKNAKLNLKWSQTTYHTFNLDQNAINILESNQDVAGSEDWDGPSKINSVDSLLVWLDSEMDHASVLLNFGNNTEPIVELVKPDGSIIRASDADDENIFYTSLPEAGTKYFTIKNPDMGKWKIYVNGQPFLPDTSYKIIYPMKVNNWLVVEADTSAIKDIDQALITAHLYDGTIPVSNVSMECYYYDLSGKRVDLTLNDDGISGDLIANDGIYSGYYSNPIYGNNQINAVMRGEMNGSKFLRQDKIGIYTFLPAVQLLSPGNGSVKLDTASVTLKWLSDTLLSNYIIQVSADSQFTQLTHYYSGIQDTTYTLTDLIAGYQYFWRIKGLGDLGEGSWSEVNTFTTLQPTSIRDKKNIPFKYELKQNFPNPFNPATTIEYSIPKSEKVELVIYDALGRKILTLVNARQQAGSYSIQVQIPKIASGVYFYRITAGEFRQVKKMLLLK